MTIAYEAGYNKSPTFTLDGGALVTLKVKSTSWTEQINALDTTHTGSGGIHARIAGLLDGNGTVEAVVDSQNMITLTAAGGIISGAKGLLGFPMGGTTPLSVHVIITQINWRAVVDGLLTVSFNCAIDSSSGSYTRAATA